MAYNENFFVNEVLLDMSAGSRYRLLWTSQGGEECWWITLDGSKRVPSLEGSSGRRIRPARPGPCIDQGPEETQG